MKVLLYFEGHSLLSHSGIGRAREHQMAALRSQNVEYTLSPKDDFDIAHINTIGTGSAHVANMAHARGKKVIVHAHSTREDFMNSFCFSNTLAPLFYKRLMHMYRKGDHLITPTVYAKGKLKEYGLTMPIHAVSNGVDTKRFCYDETKAELFRHTFRLHREQKVVVCVGFVFARKGIYDFIEAARRLPAVTFIWFGSTQGMLTPHAVRSLVRNHPSNVLFPGYVEGSVLEGALCGADAFFFPSYEETEGIAVLEALASEQQVIVRDIPVYLPWLQHGKNCYKGRNREELIRILSDSLQGRVPYLGKAARATAQCRTIEQIGKELRNIYEQVLGE